VVKLLGVERRIILKSTFSRLLDKEGTDRFLAARKAAAGTGEKERIELPLNKGSDSLWIRVNISADRDKNGAVLQKQDGVGRCQRALKEVAYPIFT